MKKIIFSLLLLVSAAAQAQQLRPNFLNQLKVLGNTNWNSLKNQQTKSADGVTYYSVKESAGKMLDGFFLELFSDEDADWIRAFRSSDPKNVQLFNELFVELVKLNKEGYRVDSTQYKGLTHVKKRLFLSRTSGFSSIIASLYENNTIAIEITPPSADNDGSLSPDFIDQFKAISTAKWEDIKGSLTETIPADKTTYYSSKKPLDAFEVEAIEVNNGALRLVQAWREFISPYSPKLYAQIKTELNKLSNEGYIVNEETGSDKDEISKILIIQKGDEIGVTINLNKDNSLEMLFSAEAKNTAAAATPTITGPAGEGSLVWIKLKDKYGLMDSLTQTVLIEPKYTAVNNFVEGIALTSFYNGSPPSGTQYAYIDTKGEIIKSGTYYDKTNTPYHFSEGLAIAPGATSFSRTGLLGYIDKAGKFFIAPNYDKAESFVNGRAKVKKGSQEFFIYRTGSTAGGEGWLINEQGKWGYRDANGNMIIQPQYTETHPFVEGMAAVKGQGWGFVDKTGKEITTPQYSEIFDFSEGLAAVKGQGAWGFIDQTGKEVLKRQYDNVLPFEDGVAWIEYKQDWGLIDKTGKTLLPYCYNQAIPLGEGLYQVKYNYDKLKSEARKWEVLKEEMNRHAIGGSTKNLIIDGGIIDKTGKKLPSGKPVNYTGVHRFKEGLAAVKNSYSRWGFIDTSGKEVIRCTYISVGDFENGKAWVKYNNGSGQGDREFYIDKTGREIKE